VSPWEVDCHAARLPAMWVMDAAIRLHASWLDRLRGEFADPYMAELKRFLLSEKERGKRIFPKGANWFSALNLTPLDEVRVVILGQDPYHGDGQAHGLCFSVPDGVRPPPSLINIYRELESDLGVRPARHGFLEHWAKQGVLLLNSVLTVEMGRAASHRDRGWERFTDAVIREVNAKPDPVVFLLWGSYAQKKAAFVLRAPHPSPLSAHSGFFGCRHFSKANAFFESSNRAPIDWALPDAATAA
jgi:uracil-DNA glycosylase